MSTNIFSFVLKYPLKQTEKSTRDFALLCIMHLDVVITSLRLYSLVMLFLYSISDFVSDNQIHMSSTKYYKAQFEKFIYILLVENEAVL